MKVKEFKGKPTVYVASHGNTIARANILKNWKSQLDQNVQPSHIHLFITLLEKGKQKKRYRTQTHRNETKTTTESAFYQ